MIWAVASRSGKFPVSGIHFMATTTVMIFLKRQKECRMWRTLPTSVLIAFSIMPATAQPDPQTALWMGIREQLSGQKGEEYFNKYVKDAMLPPLKGVLVSALINEGVSRVVLKMGESSEPEVTLVIHNGSAKLKSKPTAGTNIEFEGVAVTFSMRPFMLTFDVGIGKLRGMDFVRTAAKSERPTH
jgi:hypothetical protein